MDAVTVVGDYVRLEKRSGRFVGLCPFHNEKTPSFTVNADKKLYHCFGCGKGGTVLNFVMEMDKLTFPEAIENLAKRFGVALQYEAGAGSGEDKAVKTADALRELYERVAGSFHYLLTQNPAGKAAQDYAARRGISPDMIEAFKLGYAPADRRWLHRFLSKKGYSDEFLASSMLFSHKFPDASFFSNRLMFPIRDRQGRVAAFGGRLLSGEGPKYLNSSESPIYRKGQTLFALDRALPEIKKTKTAYLAEGYMDVIALHQAGVSNAVAPLGTAFTDDQARLLHRYAERVNLILDADEAGQNAAVKAILTCRRNGLTAGVVSHSVPPHQQDAAEDSAENGNAVPDFSLINLKDPADILKEFGEKVLNNFTKSVIIDLDYLVARCKILYDASDPEGASKAAAFLFPYLETLDSDVARDEAIGRIAALLRADRESLRNDYHNRRTRGDSRFYGSPPDSPRGRNASPQSSPAGAVRLNDELFLLAAIAVHDKLYPQFRARLSIKEIEDPAAKDLFIALEECFIHDESGLDALLPRIASESVRKFIVEHGASEEFSSNPEQLVSDGIKRIKQKRIERRLAKIVTELRLLEGGNDDSSRAQAAKEELLLEKMHIDAELRSLKERKP
jgi:DNA primase